ncbi:BCCT family transporter [Chitinibacter fontanus]|uniref:BCCT family transporter n=1 Tax=Chitinibacter fontanus TaxID=1737446 RepID=A0A7D5VAP6_9NEIS|nr:BCCT family transporter [Chitinibacter fontanus]QLI81780.1 BCCT family transporter [Chitinibacter fontanus]
MSHSASQRHTFSMPVLIPSLVLIVALIAFSTLMPQVAERNFVAAQSWITQHFSWLYVLAVSGFFLFLVGLAISDYGKIRLGADDAEPEFSLGSWLAMLFAAGMGIGLMYYGVGEPLQHYVNPPLAQGQTLAGASEAMTSTFLHWGFHAWAIYGLVGLVLAYFGFRYNLPLTLSSGLYPLLRERINGPVGHTVNVFALCCTLFGLAPSVGLGSVQLAAGIQRLTGWDTSGLAVQLALIATVIILAGISAATGIGKGVRRLSELNLFLAVVLLVFVLFTGPTLFLLGAFGDNLGNYFSQFFTLTFRSFTYTPTQSEGWLSGWTILYWAWWISWSPFVGLFIARISRGRTIREFITGVIIIPSVFTFLWMTVFGNTVIWLDMNVANGALAATAGNVDALLFKFFDYLPFSGVASVISMLLILVFFVTSADSGALMLDSLSSTDPDKSPIWQRLFWAVLLGLTSATLLSAGGQKALMTMTLIAALPFSIVMILLAFSLWRGLVADQRHSQQKFTPASSFWSGQHWKQRLEQILHQPSADDVAHFIRDTVTPALHEVALEMQQRGCKVTVSTHEDGGILLCVPQPNLRDFIYGVRAQARPVASFALRDTNLPASERQQTFEPVTFFADGRRGYDIEYMRTEELIADVLRQYERYLSLSQSENTHLINTTPEHGSGAA